MPEYISREAILGYLNDIWLTATPTDSTPAEDRQLAICRCMGLQDAMDAVKAFPAADVVEVVRCGECQHYNAGFECLIEGYGIERPADYFCADGKRKGGQDDG